MATLIPDPLTTVAPSDAEVALARESSQLLATHKLGKRTSVRLRLEDGQSDEAIAVPTSAFRLLLQLLVEMAQGNAVTLIPTQAELTTQQAADLLNVSRPYVVKLLDDGHIPSRSVGKYRRVRLADVLAYKQKDDAARTQILEQLTADAQELGLGY